MVNLFNQFKGSKFGFTSPSKRCKVQPVEAFDPKKHWSVDRWWTREEKIQLGIEEDEKALSQEDFYQILVESRTDLEEVINNGDELLRNDAQLTEITSFKAFNLGDENYFRLGIGKRVVKKYLFENKNNSRSQIPLYSANVFKPFGYLEKSNITKFENPYIIWGIDGNFDLAYIPAGEVFATTDHCGTIEILDANINPQYLLYQLNLKKHEYGFDRGLRSNMENVRQVVVEFPVLEDGSLDLEGQKVLLANNTFVMKLQAQIKELTEKLASLSNSRVIPK